MAMNLAGGASQGRVHFSDRTWAAKEYVFYDELNDARYVRSAEELCGVGLFVLRPGYDAHLVFPGSGQYGSDDHWRNALTQAWSPAFKWNRVRYLEWLYRGLRGGTYC